MSEKFVLVVSDEDDVATYVASAGDIYEVAANFSQSPSIGVIGWMASRDAEWFSIDARSKGHKVGVYATPEKARHYLYKCLALDPAPNGK